MTQEDKDLLLKDLSGRVPYGVRLWFRCYERNSAEFKMANNILGAVLYTNVYKMQIMPTTGGVFDIEGPAFDNYIQVIKPYLRPMSSMTYEEKKELAKYFGGEVDFDNINYELHWEFMWDYLTFELEWNDIIGAIDFFNRKHFDYCGLIEKGLALEAPEDMYN